MNTPIGCIGLIANASGLTHLVLAGADRPPDAGTTRDPVASGHEQAARAALAHYFDGSRRPFEGLTLAPAGTEFQRRVWKALLSIGYGETTSYGALAAQLGKPGAARAVGLANGRNPIAVIIPCHRVIGASGTLTGYGGGLPVKEWLLRHEGAAAVAKSATDRQLRLALER